MRQNQKRTKKVFSILTAGAVILTTFGSPVGNIESKAETAYGIGNPTIQKDVLVSGEETDSSEGLHNPVVKTDVLAWDTITFGNYWKEDTNDDGETNTNDEKKPIRWRVLSVEGDDAFLMADQAIESRPFDEEGSAVTWEKCSLRKWLNEDFIKEAFTEEEQAAIMETTVVNKDNEEYNTEAGADTQDRIYLLSAAEAANTAYGFDDRFYSMSRTREVKTTAYAYDQGAFASWIEEIDNNGKWWLRSPGFNTNEAAYVSEYGGGEYYGTNVTEDSFTVRPVIHLDMASNLWKKAAKVSSVTEKAPEATPSQTPNPTGVPTAVPTETPVGSQSQEASAPAGSQTPETSKSTGTQTPAAVQPEEKPVIQPSSPSQTEKEMVVSIQSAKNKKGRKVVVTWKKADGAKFYQIQYALDKKFKKKCKKTSTKKTSVTLKKLQKKKIYFIRVRACKTVNGSKVYGKWSGSSKVKIKK